MSYKPPGRGTIDHPPGLLKSTRWEYNAIKAQKEKPTPRNLDDSAGEYVEEDSTLSNDPLSCPSTFITSKTAQVKALLSDSSDSDEETAPAKKRDTAPSRKRRGDVKDVITVEDSPAKVVGGLSSRTRTSRIQN